MAKSHFLRQYLSFNNPDLLFISAAFGEPHPASSIGPLLLLIRSGWLRPSAPTAALLLQSSRYMRRPSVFSRCQARQIPFLPLRAFCFGVNSPLTVSSSLRKSQICCLHSSEFCLWLCSVPMFLLHWDSPDDSEVKKRVGNKCFFCANPCWFIDPRHALVYPPAFCLLIDMPSCRLIGFQFVTFCWPTFVWRLWVCYPKIVEN